MLSQWIGRSIYFVVLNLLVVSPEVYRKYKKKTHSIKITSHWLRKPSSLLEPFEDDYSKTDFTRTKPKKPDTTSKQPAAIPDKSQSNS